MAMTRRRVISYGLLIFVISLIIITIMTAPTRNTQITTRSENEDSEIKSLNAKILLLASKEKWWHDAYLWLIGGAVFVSIILFFSQYRESSFAKQRADAESDLNQVTDRKLAMDLAARDIIIAAADERASITEGHLADANVRISEADARAKEAEAQMASANAASKDAVSKVASAEARIAEANRASSEAPCAIHTTDELKGKTPKAIAVIVGRKP